MPNVSMFKEFKFENGAQMLPLFIDFVKFKPHHVLWMRAVSTYLENQFDKHQNGWNG